MSLRGIADGCDVVVHAGTRPGFTRVGRDRQRRINVDGTEAVLRECQSAQAKVFVLLGYTGTIQERGDLSTPVDEETPPEGEYGSASVRMICEAEALVLEANRAGSLRTMVVSPGVLAVPGMPTALGGLIAAFLRRELPYRLLDEVWLALSDGRDVGRCVASAVERGRGGRRYFATGECLRLGRLYERVTRLTGVPPPRRRLPDLLVEELGMLTPVLPPQSFLRQLVLPRALVLHLLRLAPLGNALTRAELGFVPGSLDDLLLRFARAEGVLAGDVAGAAG
jgi:nucleoside-diphosphate-sugar epimerase